MRARGRAPAFAFIATILVVGLLASLFAGAQPEVQSQPTSQAAPSTSPINVIFDTDIWSDIDDMMALAMLHTLQDRHEVNLVAVTISTDDPWCASYVDLVNTFYGHPDIPVGIVHDGMSLKRFQEKFPRHT